MKKLLIYLSVIVALFAILFVLNMQSNKANYEAYAAAANELYRTSPDKLDPDTLKQLDDPHYQNIILPDELSARLQNKENLFVYFFSPQCPHCQASTPILMPMAEGLGADIRQFNLLEFQEGWREYNIEYTPTLVYFREGKEIDRFVGGIQDPQAQEQMKQFLEKYQ
jgi:thiol-disulfide isomerase/thioredoxin